MFAKLRKERDFDWKDSNMAAVGSAEDRAVKKEAAQHEPAWIGSGMEVGLEIWRINNFKVEKWPKDYYGKFYSGDSYIILNTYKEKDCDALMYDVHFWIGKHSTQDEYGTAAYKTVELDTFHNDKPIQHREVQGHESNLFKSYFTTITTMKGGVDTGFHNVTVSNYKKRLFHVVGEKRNILVTEIQMKQGNINSEDVFIFDLGADIYQYNGKHANKDEKFKASQYIQQLKSERSGKVAVEVLDEGDISHRHPVFSLLKKGKSKEDDTRAQFNTRGMYQISDSSGVLKFTTVLEGDVDLRYLDSDDVFLVDMGNHLYVWIGEKASVDERHNAMAYAHNFLKDKLNPFCPVTCLGEKQAQSSKEFMKLFNVDLV